MTGFPGLNMKALSNRIFYDVALPRNLTACLVAWNIVCNKDSIFAVQSSLSPVLVKLFITSQGLFNSFSLRGAGNPRYGHQLPCPAPIIQAIGYNERISPDTI